ncbi:uncharacterized protein LACBIDRAFT_313356 [Laccaria bicolor S238N-H82]|uniref:Predicted protein n=1 Tax=Laccaria bicolor (strain S238N-H82 / ATCC MYA-4686) TaxID=486041 RepID=B0DY51_LACBS|nr:uncharacterized protein LACBIDRAFT_313356 [Laccaria bicolor S238N-H82]EDR00500.1 predicted protein [Laccaria bicolor S238N-H82]|eukprot:XP_001888892.1 predicted protein [Laccaria bicolor S238N-H82]
MSQAIMMGNRTSPRGVVRSSTAMHSFSNFKYHLTLSNFTSQLCRFTSHLNLSNLHFNHHFLATHSPSCILPTSHKRSHLSTTTKTWIFAATAAAVDVCDDGAFVEWTWTSLWSGVWGEGGWGRWGWNKGGWGMGSSS